MRYPGNLVQLPSSLAPLCPAGLRSQFWDNLKNFSMKLSGNISEICIFRNMLKKSIFWKI